MTTPLVEGEFASLDDLAVILGRLSAADFTAPQAVRGALLLTLSTGLIVTAVDRDEAWALALAPVPLILRAVCLEVAARVMRNPSGARSESETLGQHQHSVSWTDGAHGMMLTDAEVLLCRRAAIGVTSGSANVDSVITQIANGDPVIAGVMVDHSLDVFPWL